MKRVGQAGIPCWPLLEATSRPFQRLFKFLPSIYYKSTPIHSLGLIFILFKINYIFFYQKFFHPYFFKYYYFLIIFYNFSSQNNFFFYQPFFHSYFELDRIYSNFTIFLLFFTTFRVKTIFFFTYHFSTPILNLIEFIQILLFFKFFFTTFLQIRIQLLSFFKRLLAGVFTNLLLGYSYFPPIELFPLYCNKKFQTETSLKKFHFTYEMVLFYFDFLYCISFVFYFRSGKGIPCSHFGLLWKMKRRGMRDFWQHTLKIF